MASFRWVILLSALAAATVVAQETQPLAEHSDAFSLSSSYARRLDVMGTIPQQASQGRQEMILQEAPARKSVGLAAIYSLLLPGMGELYAGGFSSGRYFLAAEGAFWITYAAFEIRGNELRDDARSFAVVHAGVQPAGKDDQFFVDVGNFANTAEFNDKVLRDRNIDRVYNPAAGYGWQWDSEASRMAFKDQRIVSENAYNNRKFVVAAILINHVASAINAARIAVAHNNALVQLLDGVDLHAEVIGGSPVYSLSLRRTF